jgi:hypothetical protein
MAIVKRGKNASVDSVDSDERRRPRDLAGLTLELGNPNPIPRRWAARDLALFVEAAPALIALLEREEDPTVREAVLLSLVEIGNAVAVQGMVNCLSDVIGVMLDGLGYGGTAAFAEIREKCGPGIAGPEDVRPPSLASPIKLMERGAARLKLPAVKITARHMPRARQAPSS